MEITETGIKGLDDLLGGGLPKGRCVLVVGGPGSGKTIFAMQYLMNGAKKDERGLYITLDERPDHVKANMTSFGWDLDKLESQGKILLLDATPLRRTGRTISDVESHEVGLGVSLPELTLNSLIRTVHKIVEEEGIQRIAVDPITSMILRYHELPKRRRAVLLFFDALINTQCTSVVTSELRTGALDRGFAVEEFLSQGVILLHTLVHEGNVIKAIQIEKMRGIPHDTQMRPYRIGKDGLEIFPKDKVF
jgi:KaiC/GvpD/RAD55 family RecA-like ATPase